MESALLATLVVLFLLLILHDLLPMGRWNNLEHATSQVSPVRLVTAVVTNGMLGAVPLILSYLSRGVRHPTWQRETTASVLAFLFIGELLAWWIPLPLRCAPRLCRKLKPIFAGTYSFLPERNGITPNALHCLMHSITLLGLVLSIFVMRL